MSSIKRITMHGHTAAVEHNGVLYLGGVAAEDLSLPIADQTRSCIEQIEEVLAAAGSSKASILHAKVNLKSFADKDEMNKVWVDWLGEASLPSRSTNGGIDMGEGVLIEIVVVAAKEAI